MTNPEILKRAQHAQLNRRLALALGYTSGEIDTSDGKVRVYRPDRTYHTDWRLLDCDDQATWKPIAAHFKLKPEAMLGSNAYLTKGQQNLPKAWSVKDLKFTDGRLYYQRWCIAPSPGQAVAKSVISLMNT